MRQYIRESLEMFIKHFELLKYDVDALILFGSQARGTAVVSSDIDIAVVHSVPLTSQERGTLRCLGEDIGIKTEINLFFTTPQAIADAEGVFDTNKYIREEGVILWEK